MKTPRFYLDTSVFGGYFDTEFEKPTRRLFEDISRGLGVGLLSGVVLRELSNAPPEVADLCRASGGIWELVEESAESLELAETYLTARVVPEQLRDDCLHVALATVHRADVLVSWNLKHIVQYHRIRGFNGVNLAQGYGVLDIRTPQEVIRYE